MGVSWGQSVAAKGQHFRASISWLAWAFLPSPTPGRKLELARVNEELKRLSGLSPSLQGENGHLSTKSCPFKTWPVSMDPLSGLAAKSRAHLSDPPSLALRPRVSSFLFYNLYPHFPLYFFLNPRGVIQWEAMDVSLGFVPLSFTLLQS